MYAQCSLNCDHDHDLQLIMPMQDIHAGSKRCRPSSTKPDVNIILYNSIFFVPRPLTYFVLESKVTKRPELVKM